VGSVDLTHGKATQRSTRKQVSWLLVRPGWSHVGVERA